MTALDEFDRALDAGRVPDVGLDDSKLADLAQRLDEIGIARVAAGNPDSDAALHQKLADVAADESIAAEYGDKLFAALDHGWRDSLWVPRLTRRGERP